MARRANLAEKPLNSSDVAAQVAAEYAYNFQIVAGEAAELADSAVWDTAMLGGATGMVYGAKGTAKSVVATAEIVDDAGGILGWIRNLFSKSDDATQSIRGLTQAQVDELISKGVTALRANTPDSPGSYTITFKSGKKYHGKGPPGRMLESAKRLSKEKSDPVVDLDWTSAATEDEAFKQEHTRIQSDGGPNPK